MPIIALEVPETYDNITRPVVVGISRDLINRLGLPEDTRLIFAGSSETVQNSREPKTKSSVSRVKVQMEEMYLEEGVLNTPVKRSNTQPIFDDKGLLVSMRPVYTKTETTLTFTYIAKSKVEADRWRDSMRRRVTEALQMMLHEFIYHYSPPEVFHYILKEIYSKREAMMGYGDTFEEWLSKHYNQNMTILVNKNGTQGLLTIAEKQINVQGWFDFNTEPEKPEKADNAGRWETTFNYTFQYDKPTAMVITYPIVVHNQLLDDKVLPLAKPYDPYERNRSPSIVGSLSDYFSLINYNKEPLYRGVVIPDFDDWEPALTRNKVIPVFTALVACDLDDPYQILNLKDLGDADLDPVVLEFIRLNKADVVNYMANIFHITFYKGRMEQDGATIHLDDDLNLRSTVALDPRTVHHVRLSIFSDLRSLSRKGTESLRQSPSVAKSVIDFIEEMHAVSTNALYGSTAVKMSDTINPVDVVSGLPPKIRADYNSGAFIQPVVGTHYTRPNSAAKQGPVSGLLKVLGGKLITKDSLNAVITHLKSPTELTRVGQGRGIKTISSVGIIARRAY